jgi:A/G-specific adenine glycosylase
MNKKEKELVRTVKEYYRRHGRRSLPWRRTRDPYHILVSEVMLQQTQVERVIPKYKLFLRTFPAVHTLAQSSLSSVLRVWQGLGYNRRAKMLHECAKRITKKYNGQFPRTHEELMELPGIGHYTAGALMAFAFNKPIPVIETNIRSVYLHHFFKGKTDITDAEITRLVERTLDTKNPREWYYALMDYGAHIKKEFGNPNSRSKHYARQSAFKGSDREIRGAIIRLLAKKSYTRAQFQKELLFSDIRIDATLMKLIREALIMFKHGRYHLSS